MLEVEAKIRVEDLGPLRRRLQRLGAKPRGTSIQRDVYLNAPHRDFARTDEALRVRYSGGSAEVTYKGAKLPTSGLKTRHEVNLKVESGETFERLMGHLGFVKTAEVTKEREEYAWNGAIIALDRVNGLGEFVEIEVVTDGDPAVAEQRIERIEKELGVTGAHITASYLEMILAIP